MYVLQCYSLNLSHPLMPCSGMAESYGSLIHRFFKRFALETISSCFVETRLERTEGTRAWAGRTGTEGRGIERWCGSEPQVGISGSRVRVPRTLALKFVQPHWCHREYAGCFPAPPMLGNEPRFPGRRQQGLRDAEVNCSLTCVTESSPSALQPQPPFPPLTATRLGSLYPLCRVSRALEEKKKEKRLLWDLPLEQLLWGIRTSFPNQRLGHISFHCITWLRIPLQCRRPRFDPWVGKIPWRRAWQPTPVFLPGEPHGQRSLVGYNPCGCQESDRTEGLSTITCRNPKIGKGFV